MTKAARTSDDADARIIFRAGDRRFALSAGRVRELVRLPRVTPVPLAPPTLMGLASVRGETLAILSPREGVQASSAKQLLVLDGVDRIGIAVDLVERVERGTADEVIDDLAIDALISRASPPRPASRRAANGNMAAAAVVHRDDRLAVLRFAIGDQSFALPLDEVVEVLPMPDDVARLPGGDAAVAGTILWRDETLGVLSLAALLGLPSRTGMLGRIVVAALGGHRIGLLVDRIEGLMRVAPDRIDPVPPSLLRSEADARIRAICRPESGRKLISILAADQLVGEARTRRLLAHGGQGGQQSASAVQGAQRPFLRFRIGPHHLAFPLGAIEQVMTPPVRITPVPAAPTWLAGIAAIDGEPLAIVDQVARLTGRAASGTHRRLIVARIGGRRLGFLVDEAKRIVTAEATALAPAPLPEALAAGIFGEAFALEQDDTLLVVDPAAMISAAEQALLDGIAASRPISHA